MASLQELLAKEGFERGDFLKNPKQIRFRDRNGPDESIALPICICHDRRSIENSKNKAAESVLRRGSWVFSSKREGSCSEILNATPTGDGGPGSAEAAIDEVTAGVVVSILSGYIGRYIKDKGFREAVRRKCHSCLTRRNNDSDNAILANMELGIESIEKLVENPGIKNKLRVKFLRNSIRLLSIAASMNSKSSGNDSTCGIPNSHLSACAQLYLSVVYKLEKNDLISAWHLLQVFCVSPFLARTNLLPDLWDHFFLPHLLHLKIWYGEELEFLSNSAHVDKEKKMKALSMSYNDQMDRGTTQFAMYYKEWLKVGAQAPRVPSVPLPSRPSYGSSRRISSDSFVTHSSINKSLYRTVFGPTSEWQSMDLNIRNQVNIRDLEEEERVCTNEDSVKKHHNVESEPAECFVRRSNMGSNYSIRTESTQLPTSDLSRAITTLCSSESLSDCEAAIRVITKTWLDLHGDPTIETALSNAPVIKGMLEVLLSSNDDEILELTISVLAVFVIRNEANRHFILNLDAQLDIFMRLLRSSSLFLKAAVLLYLVKPKAKQMISIEWVPLVLRVLEFGDHLQTLLAVQCCPKVAAYYFLDQLLTGFDEDKNFENARQVVSTGGLSLLLKRVTVGDIYEKTRAAAILFCCVRADGSCRHYLANNLNKGSILELLVLRKQRNSNWHAFALLTELLCLSRRTEAIRFLNELLSGWGNLNTMQILFVYLQKARVEERPMVAAVLLQLDLLGDPLKSSVYRQEAVEAIIAALDCQMCNEKVQEQSARALSILGGHFSYTGQATAEKWLLKEAGFVENYSGDSFQGRDNVIADLMQSNEEDEEMQNWPRKAAIAMLSSGRKRLLAALADSIANGIPWLARASLVTLSWMSIYLHSIGDEGLQSEACSILVPHLIESLNYDRALEERVLASFTFLTLAKSSDCFSELSPMDKGMMMGHLWNLSEVTWTAKELILIITSSSRHQCLELSDHLPDENRTDH